MDKTIDLNATSAKVGQWDMGNDTAMIELATSATSPCGFHAEMTLIAAHRGTGKSARLQASARIPDIGPTRWPPGQYPD